MSPSHVQRQRTKGWTMPPDSIYVGRPSRWGNPFRVVRTDGPIGPEDRLLEVMAFERWMRREGQEFLTIDLTPLRGKTLVCWCPADGRPCHADVLADLAARPTLPEERG